MCVVMIEPDIVMYKRGPVELLVLFDRGIEVMSAVEGKAVEADRVDGGDGSHVQEGLER